MSQRVQCLSKFISESSVQVLSLPSEASMENLKHKVFQLVLSQSNIDVELILYIGLISANYQYLIVPDFISLIKNGR